MAGIIEVLKLLSLPKKIQSKSNSIQEITKARITVCSNIKALKNWSFIHGLGNCSWENNPLIAVV